MSIDSTLNGWMMGLARPGLDLAIRATALLAVVLAAWWAVGRRRPLIGSAIGQAGLLGLLLLPISSRLGPPLAIPILEAPAVVPPSTTIEPPVPAIELPDFSGSPDVPADPVDFEAPPPIAAKVPTPPALATVDPAPVTPGNRPAIDAASSLVGIYVLVMAFLLVRLAGSLAGVGRLLRSSVEVDDPAWLGMLERVRDRLGVARPVGLARSGRVGVPVVVGWLRPTILLPDSPGGPPLEHAEAILLHELAHVRRGDYAWNVVLRLVEALYWPHPMAWLLGRAVAESRERACDAFCVHQMGGPAAYRATLLAMAEGLSRRPAPTLGLAMARPSRLGRRVAEIDRGRGEARCLPRWPSRLALGSLALALAATLGPARITHARPRAEPSAPPAPVPAPIVEQEPKKAAEPARAPAAGRVLRLRVVAADTGKPIPKAVVRVWLALRDDDWRQTDDDGRLEIVHSTGPADRHLSVDAWGDGYAEQRHQWGGDPKVPVPDEATIQLRPGESLGGLVRDEEGRPVAGAAVYLWSHNYKKKDPAELLYDLRAITGPDGHWQTGGAPETTGELLGIYITHPDYISDREYVSGREKPPIADLRAGKAVSVMKKGVPIEGRVLTPDGKPVAGALVIPTDRRDALFNGLQKYAVRTDAEGRFRTGQVKAGEWHLVVKAGGFAPAARKLEVGPAIPFEEVRLAAPHSFRARVVDPEGKPIEGAFVNIDTWNGYRCLGVYLYSDPDGRVRWDDAPEDDLRVNVDREGYLGLFSQTAQAGSDLTFTLRPALTISGIVRDAESKRGVESAVVEYGAVDPTTGEVSAWRKPPQIGWVWYSGGYLNARFAVEADAYKLRITSEGYKPFVSRAFKREEKVVTHYDVTLEPGRAEGPVATVLRPDGRPLAGARVIRGQRNRNVSTRDDIAVDGGPVAKTASGPRSVTGPDGTFPIPQGDEPAFVVILGDDCFAASGAKALAANPRLQARPYARVEGRYLAGDRPVASRPIELFGLLQDNSTEFVVWFFGRKATTDAEGRFAFEKVIPMPGLRIGRKDTQDAPGRVWTSGEPVKVEDGKTSVVTIGGKGRPVVGRVEPPEGWDRPINFTNKAEVAIESDRTQNPMPLELLRGKTSLEDRGWQDWLRTWSRSPEGRAYADQHMIIRVAPAPDGSFRVDDVPPGDYRVTIRVNEWAVGRDRGPFEAIARTITIPPIPGGRLDEPLDLGALRLKARARARARAGDPAPAFEVTTVDGKKLAIPGDFAGKYLLLDFGTTWDMQSRLQVVRMNDVFARFGKDDRFALLSLLMAADRPESRAFVAEKGEPWPQSIVGPVSNPIAEAYAIEPDQSPAAILIGPDGRIVARDLLYDKIGEAIARALGAK